MGSISPEERALLDAVIADPADDTVRLVYADWLDERGRPARAGFIRAQIEAEQHHPASPDRAELDVRAQRLLAENWIDWWAPVCEAVGLPAPKRGYASRLGRFAQAVRLTTPVGRPYQCLKTFVEHFSGIEWVPDTPPQGFHHADFRRGFPDTLDLILWRPEATQLLTRWPTAAPLDRLSVALDDPAFWADGPFLRGLRTLTVNWCSEGFPTTVFDSAHLDRLDDMSFLRDGVEDRLDPELSRLMSHPRTRQIRRLSLPVRGRATAEAIAQADGLYGLRTLSVDTRAGEGTDVEDMTAAGERLTILAGSPYLAGLAELTVIGIFDPAGYRAVTTGPAWNGLRKLTIVADLDAEGIESLLAEATLPALEDLLLNSVVLTPRSLDQLVRSPLMKQLRHIWIGLCHIDSIPADELRRFPGIFDPERVETLTFVLDPKIPGVDELKRQLGNRMRILRQ